MTQKPISDAKKASPSHGVPVRVVIIALDSNLSSTIERAQDQLKSELPGLTIELHAVTEFLQNDRARAAAEKAVSKADILLCSLIFLEEHVRAVKPMLEARRDDCDCMVGAMSDPELVRLTKLGQLDMQKPATGLVGLLKRLRGKQTNKASAGKNQLKLLRSIPKVLKFIPGKAQDLRGYFLAMQYMLAASDENVANMMRFLVSRYASGPRAILRERVTSVEPREYPDVGLYHPDLPQRVTDSLDVLEKLQSASKAANDAKVGTVGVLVLRSYLLADNTAHYDAVIRALELRGLNVVTVFASGLDARPAIDAFLKRDGRPAIDVMLSLTGFSLVGGPAYNDAAAAEEALAELDVPYLSAFAVEFQSLEQWEASDNGLTPLETTLMVALPEIDGATGPMLFGGRREASGSRNLQPQMCRVEMLAQRVAKLARLRAVPKAERRVATVIFNFPPNGGAVGTAANLSVYESLFSTLKAMKADGYKVDLPADVDALRAAIIEGNASQYGTPANVAAQIPADTHVLREPWLEEIEAAWGPAPGKELTNGRDLFIMGAHFGNVFVGVQPAFGYEGDPMRMLFEKTFAPTHAFCAFYRYLKADYDAHAVLHFGTHGALEFMPGKQVGLSCKDWPDRLIGDLPNIYFYASNNPSEGTIAKRRAAATLVSYLTPPVAHAGLYKGLSDLKSSIDHWRGLPASDTDGLGRAAQIIRDQAEMIDLASADETWSATGDLEVPALSAKLTEYEAALIPYGLHVAGQAPSAEEVRDMLGCVNEVMGDAQVQPAILEAILDGRTPKLGGLDDAQKATANRLMALKANLSENHEISGLLHALDGRYVRPVSGGDVLRSPEIVPTGRNVHGFDPFRLPTAFAIADGKRQADILLERYKQDQSTFPRSIAMVLWGTDNLKTEGAQIAQALSLIGATARFDSFGRLAGADLISLEELGRPRVDVMMTLSGIFRDLLPLQTRLLAEAAQLAAAADEPDHMNPIRANAKRHMAEHGGDLETAALRVFSNAAGAYGANVNLLIESGAWEDGDELADTYTARKSFAYGVDGQPVQQREVLTSILKTVDAAYQNIESIENGVTSIDHYFDTLGGISRAVKKETGRDANVYVGDTSGASGKVRSLDEQVSLETRTRMLNPKWYDGLLKHGYEGVRQIEVHVTNTLGWSATTGKVDPWVYKHLSETYLLDPEMRQRLAELNPQSSAKLAGRLIEAGERGFWEPSDEMWAALQDANDELEDRLEGILPDGETTPTNPKKEVAA